MDQRMDGVSGILIVVLIGWGLIARQAIAELKETSQWDFDDLEVTSESMIYPVEGTIGTQITIRGSGFGVKKGKVLIQREVLNEKTSKAKKIKLSLKLAKDGWTDTLITGTVPKALPLGVYDLTILPKKAPTIVYEASFNVKRPQIESISPTSGKWGDEVTVRGNYFGSKEGEVALLYYDWWCCEWIVWTCDLKKRSWQMDPVTGESVVTFIVPCGPPPEILDVAILNKAGFGLEEGIFVYAYVSCPGGGVPRDCVPCFID